MGILGVIGFLSGFMIKKGDLVPFWVFSAYTRQVSALCLSLSLSQIPSFFFLFGLNKVFGVLINYIWYEATKLRYAIKKHYFLDVYAGIWTNLNRAKGDG